MSQDTLTNQADRLRLAAQIARDGSKNSKSIEDLENTQRMVEVALGHSIDDMMKYKGLLRAQVLTYWAFIPILVYIVVSAFTALPYDNLLWAVWLLDGIVCAFTSWFMYDVIFNSED